MYRRTATNGSSMYYDFVPLTKVFTPLRTKNLIPSEMGILMKRGLANPNKCLIASFPDHNWVQQMIGTCLELKVSKLSKPKDIEQRWWSNGKNTGYTETYTQNKMHTFEIPAESKTFQLKLGNNETQLPQRIHWAFMGENALAGHYRENNHELLMPKIQSIKLKSATGDTYLERQTYNYTTDEENYRDLWQTFRQQQDPRDFTKNMNHIPLKTWSHGGYGLFSWDMSRSETANLENIISEPRPGPFIMEFDFREKLQKKLNLVVMEEIPASWSLSNDYKVTFNSNTN